MSGRAQLIQRSRQVKRRRKMIQLVGLVFLILIALGLTIYTFHRPRWRIDEVKIIGVKSLNSAEIESLIKQETSSSYLWLIPRNSRLFYPEKTLIEKITQKFPRVASLKMDKSGVVLKVGVVERESELLWCSVGEADMKDCYFVDVTGMAFARAPNFTDHVLFEVHKKTGSTSVATSSALGEIVLLPDVLKNIFSQKEAIHKVLANQKMFDRSIITSVEILPGNSYAFNVISPGLAEERWFLMTHPKMSGEPLSKLLIAFLDSGSFDKNVARSEQSLLYIDARLDSKVFFKVSGNHATSTP